MKFTSTIKKLLLKKLYIFKAFCGANQIVVIQRLDTSLIYHSKLIVAFRLSEYDKMLVICKILQKKRKKKEQK